MRFIDLPQNLFLSIHSYLCVRPLSIHNSEVEQFDLDNYNSHETLSKEVRDNAQWRHFMNTSALLFGVKKKTNYLALNQTWSAYFLTDRFFRAFIIELFLDNPHEQLSLRYTNAVPCYLHVACKNVHVLTLEYIKGLSTDSIPNVKILHLRSCRLTEAEITVHAETVRFDSMEYLNFSNIKFTQLQKLYLFNCTAIMFFGYLVDNNKLRLLSMRTCSTAATAIKSIKKLDCGSISILKIGNELSDRFYNVTNVNYLNIENLHSTKTLSRFLNLEKLDLNVSSIPSLPLALTKLQRLSLQYCNKIVEMEITLSFRFLKQLEMRDCMGLQKLIIHNISSFERLILLDNFPALELIDIRASSLKRLIVSHVKTQKPLKCILHHIVPTIQNNGTQIIFRYLL
jgi:hypothetical protein